MNDQIPDPAEMPLFTTCLHELAKAFGETASPVVTGLIIGLDLAVYAPEWARAAQARLQQEVSQVASLGGEEAARRTVAEFIEAVGPMEERDDAQPTD